MCFCTGTTEYDPYHEPAPRVPTHTAYARPASHHSVHHRRNSTIALPPPHARRSYDHQQHHYRSSTSSMPSRYVEYEPQSRHSVQLVERRPRSSSRVRGREVSPGAARVVRTERERVVYV